MHIASRLGKTEIVQLLLQHMAHPDAATTNGYTPLHISAREGRVDVASVLLEAGAAQSLATKVRGSLATTWAKRDRASGSLLFGKGCLWGRPLTACFLFHYFRFIF